MTLTRESLWTLEHYARVRNDFRAEVIAHKRLRSLALGEHVTMLFEDEMTIRYQVQEMLRIEKIFEDAGIRDELEAYTPLIPDGRNFKATMMIEYSDPEVRAAELRKLKGIEDRVWLQVEGREKVWAIADEDLERENDEKTSAVHFLRFELDTDMAEALKYGVALSAGISHPQYTVKVEPVAADFRNALVKDLK
ncbi:MAG: hypothetical protein RIS59_847 [Pseudomonadota bacterium]|jgi:hypothetical protein|nr:DUF3501 family protein [Burkholderiales bacterium]